MIRSLVVLVLLIPTAVEAATCRVRSIQRIQQVITSAVVPFQYTPQVYGQTPYYQQQEAVATKDFRNSEEWQHYQQLLGYQQAVRELQQKQEWTEPTEVGEELLDKLTAPTQESSVIASKASISTTCVKCHSGEEPKGGVDLSEPAAYLSGGQAPAVLRDRIIRAIRTGHMPPGDEGVRDLELTHSIEDELYGINEE